MALMLALGATIIGPYVLRSIAEGIARSPSSGIPVELWVVWQLTIALAALAVLIVAGIAAESAIGERRGVPAVWVVVLITALALVGPMVWRPPGAWPEWYPRCGCWRPRRRSSCGSRGGGFWRRR